MSKNAKRQLKAIQAAPPPEPPPGASFKEKLHANAYTTKLPWPHRRILGVENPDYEKEMAACYADISRLTEEFKRDMFAHYEVTGHPKVEIAYRIAWGHGHSSGYSEVDGYFSDLVELLQPDHS